MKNEYRLILNAVLRSRTSAEENQLDELLAQTLDWELIGGQLLSHRLGGYFYSGIGKERIKRVPKEILKALELLVMAQKKQTLGIIDDIIPILKEFEQEGIRYAGLKGLVFNAGLYNPGDRRSNDTDLLVYEADLDKLDIILRNHGYIQSFMTNGELKEASRKDKLLQRMNYHDLVPYIKLLNNEFVSKQEIDINFHFDSKENDITLNVFNKGTEIYENQFYTVRGLPWETNLAHLCIHFYREAANSIWTKGKRDVTLYKLVDIINEIRSCIDKEKIKKWPELMKSLSLGNAAYFTIFTLSEFYKDETIKLLMDSLKPEDTSFLYEIKVNGENRTERRKQAFIDVAFDLKR